MIINQPKKVFFSFHGRINRTTFWAYQIPFIALQVVLRFMEEGMFPYPENVLLAGIVDISLGLIALVSIWPMLAIGVKRWHDRDKSGWWMLIGLVPLVGAIWAFVECGCLKGTEGKNEYGEDPFIEHQTQ